MAVGRIPQGWPSRQQMLAERARLEYAIRCGSFGVTDRFNALSATLADLNLSWHPRQERLSPETRNGTRTRVPRESLSSSAWPGIALAAFLAARSYLPCQPFLPGPAPPGLGHLTTINREAIERQHKEDDVVQLTAYASTGSAGTGAPTRSRAFTVSDGSLDGLSDEERERRLQALAEQAIAKPGDFIIWYTQP